MHHEARLLLACPTDPREAFSGLGAGVEVERDLGAVSVVSGALGERPGALRRALDVLTAAGFSPGSVHTAPLRWSAILPTAEIDDAVRALHAAFGGAP